MPVRGFRPPNRRVETVPIAQWNENKEADESPRLRSQRKKRDEVLASKIGEAKNVPRLAPRIPLGRAINVSDVKSCLNNPSAPLFSSFSANDIFDPAVDEFLVLRRKLQQQSFAEQRRQSVLSARDHRNTVEDTRDFYGKYDQMREEDRKLRAQETAMVERIVQDHDTEVFSLEQAADAFAAIEENHQGSSSTSRPVSARPQSAMTRQSGRSTAGGAGGGSRPGSARLIPKSSIISSAATAASSTKEKRKHRESLAQATTAAAADTEQQEAAVAAAVSSRPSSGRGVVFTTTETDQKDMTIDEMLQADQMAAKRKSSTTSGGSFGPAAAELSASDSAADIRPSTAPVPGLTALQKLRQLHGVSAADGGAAAAGSSPRAAIRADILSSPKLRRAMQEAAALRQRVAQVRGNAAAGFGGGGGGASSAATATAVDEQLGIDSDQQQQQQQLYVPELADEATTAALADGGSERQYQQQQQQQHHNRTASRSSNKSGSGTAGSFFVTQPDQASANLSLYSSGVGENAQMDASSTSHVMGASTSARPRIGRYPSGNDAPTAKDLLFLMSQCNQEKSLQQQQQQHLRPSRPSTARVYSCRSNSSSNSTLRRETAAGFDTSSTTATVNTIEEFEQRSSTVTVPFVRQGAVDALQEWLKLSPRSGRRG